MGAALLDTTGGSPVSNSTFELNDVGSSPSPACPAFQECAGFESVPSVYGDGPPWVVGSVFRLGTKTAVAGAASRPTSGGPKAHLSGAILAGGATRFDQVWCRDGATSCTPAGFNLSHGTKVILVRVTCGRVSDLCT